MKPGEKPRGWWWNVSDRKHFEVTVGRVNVSRWKDSGQSVKVKIWKRPR